jgi:hypothetical protein
MYGACALAIAALIVGLATLPSVRTMIAQQHPGSSPDAIRKAADIAAVVIGIRALTGVGTWWWAARDATRGRRHAGITCALALAVTTVALASSYLQGLSTSPMRLLYLADWLAGLGAIAFAVRRRPHQQESAG